MYKNHFININIKVEVFFNRILETNIYNDNLTIKYRYKKTGKNRHDKHKNIQTR